jgi:hypothetical protein
LSRFAIIIKNSKSIRQTPPRSATLNKSNHTHEKEVLNIDDGKHQY